MTSFVLRGLRLGLNGWMDLIETQKRMMMLRKRGVQAMLQKQLRMASNSWIGTVTHYKRARTTSYMTRRGLSRKLQMWSEHNMQMVSMAIADWQGIVPGGRWHGVALRAMLQASRRLCLMPLGEALGEQQLD